MSSPRIYFLVLIGVLSSFSASSVAQNVAVEEWVACYHFDFGSLAVDGEGNVYVTGRWPGEERDYVTAKLSPGGDQLWEARYNGPAGMSDEPASLAVDSEENVYVTGTSAGSGTGIDYATVKYSAQGEELWVARYRHGGASALAVDAE